VEVHDESYNSYEDFKKEYHKKGQALTNLDLINKKALISLDTHATSLMFKFHPYFAGGPLCCQVNAKCHYRIKCYYNWSFNQLVTMIPKGSNLAYCCECFHSKMFTCKQVRSLKINLNVFQLTRCYSTLLSSFCRSPYLWDLYQF